MKKANRGDAINIPASNWNRLCDLAGQRVTQTPGNADKIGSQFVYVKNTLGRDLSRFAAVCVGSPTDPTLHDGKNDVVFTLINGALVSKADNTFYCSPTIGILPEPIANGRIGLAQIYGVTPASFRWEESIKTSPSDFATMSDLGDRLSFSQFGAVRVLQRGTTVNSNSDTKFWWVELGTEPSMGSVVVNSSTDLVFNAAPDLTMPSVVWPTITGDGVHVGVYGNDGISGFLYPIGNLRIGRPGRYHVTVRYAFIVDTASYASTDTLEWQVNWGDGFNRGSGTPAAWGGSLGTLSGERSFFYNPVGTPVSQLIPTPGIQVKKITSAGTVTTSTISNGRLQVEVLRIGSYGLNSYWSKALADAAWARGSTAGPI